MVPNAEICGILQIALNQISVQNLVATEIDDLLDSFNGFFLVDVLVVYQVRSRLRASLYVGYLLCRKINGHYIPPGNHYEPNTLW